jgi:hypothetical protein
MEFTSKQTEIGAAAKVGAIFLPTLDREAAMTPPASSDNAFAEACRKTGRTNSSWRESRLTSALHHQRFAQQPRGFSVTAVVDASGSPTQLTDEMAFRRMERGGVKLTTTTALLSELADNCAIADGKKFAQIIGEEILSHG